MTKELFDLILISWIDAETTHGWCEVGELDTTLPPATTVGFLVAETDELYLVAGSVSGTSTNVRMKVPKGMVIDVQKINLPRKKKAKEKPSNEGQGELSLE